MASKDVEIVIGAKNQASRILQDVQKDTRNLGTSIKKTAKDGAAANRNLAVSFQNLKSVAGPLIAAYAAIKTATAGFRFVGDSLGAFEQQEEAVRSLTQALALSGDKLGPTIEQHKAFASELQRITNVGDEVTLEMMKQASMLGVEGSQLQDVTKAAIGLSEALGIGQTEAMKKVLQATQGNANALGEFIPAVRAAATEEEKLAAVMDVAQKGLQQKAGKADTAAGAMQRARNSMGDFKEVIGEALAPIQRLVGTGLAVLAETLSTSVVPAIKSVMPSAETMNSVIQRMTEVIVSSVTFIETIVGNMPKVWQIMVASASLQIIRLVEGFKHAFTVVIPQYASWFANNIVNMMADTFNATVSIVSNAAQNIGDMFKAMWDFIKSGGSGGIEGLMANIMASASRGLLDGFEAQTEPLPEILARQITDGEKALMKEIDSLTASLATEYNEKLQKRLDALKVQQKADMELSIKATGKKEDGKDSGKNAAGEITAMESRLLTRGKGDNIAKQQLDEQKKAVKVAEKIVAVVERSLNKPATESVTFEMVGG